MRTTIPPEKRALKITITGNEVTRKWERKRASRTAFPATKAAIMEAADFVLGLNNLIESRQDKPGATKQLMKIIKNRKGAAGGGIIVERNNMTMEITEASLGVPF